MAQTDLEINKNIRKVLVRHWVDLGRLRMSSAGGRIYIRGLLTKIPGQGTTDLATANVDAIFSELKRIPHVKWVSADLENWTDANGTWIPIEQKKQSLKHTNEANRPSSFDLSKDN